MSPIKRSFSRFPAALLAALLLGACTMDEPDPYVPQLGYMTKIGELFRVSFRTSHKLGERFLPTGGSDVAARLECRLDTPAPAPQDEADRRRLFRAPVKLVRSREITPDGRFQFSAMGDFIEAGRGAGARRLADAEIEAAIAGRTAIPCRFVVPTENGEQAVIATMELPSLNVHAAIRDIPPSDVGRTLMREGGAN